MEEKKGGGEKLKAQVMDSKRIRTRMNID